MRHGDDASNDWIQSLLKNGKPAPRSPYLEPEDSPFSRGPGMRLYEEMLAASLLVATESESQSLAPAWQQEERAILVCLPSFQPEWTLSVVGEESGLLGSIGGSTKEPLVFDNILVFDSGRSRDTLPPSVNIYRSELAANLGGAVCDIWSRVLSQTRYPPERWSGCDGVTYHFAYCRSGIRGIPERSGKTWSPEEESVPGKLVGLSHALGDYAKDSANQDVFLKVIQDHIEWFQTHSQQLSS